MKTKIKKARKLSQWGKYPQTWQAIISQIPDFLILKLTSKEIASMIDNFQQPVFQAGKYKHFLETLENGFIATETNIYNLQKK